MPSVVRRLATVAVVAVAVLLTAVRASAQNLSQSFPNGLPSPEQARELLRTQPALVEQLRQRLASSNLTPDQVRARLRAAGYPETMLDEFLGKETPAAAALSPQTVDAARSLGILSAEEADSLRIADSLAVISDSLRRRIALRADSARVDSLADSLRTLRSGGLKLFGIETFRRTSNAFQPTQAGPVDEHYQLGPGDVLVLILTGDVEQVHTLEVTREGFILIPQVGQVYVANLTLAQLEQQLYSRLGRVYSGVRRSPNATTKFQLSLARLRSVQVYVVGDVVRPGAYQISAAGTILSALYAAGGPTDNGSFRRIEVRRGNKLLDSVDVYDYLLRGINRSDVRLQSGDVVFVPVHGGYVKVTGKVTRSAIYEVLPNETLRDVIGFAGGFDPAARQTRMQIHRILPPDARGDGSRARVVVDIGPDQFAGGTPAVPMAAGDSVKIFGVAEQVRGYVTVRGNVWVEGQIGLTPGMKLSDAIRLAGGPKPDSYVQQILVARRREDSTLVQLRSAFADSTGRLANDLVLEDQDEINVFAHSTFRELPYVSIVGAVRRSGRIQFREGMTLRDAVLLAGGVTPDADLKEAELARRLRDGQPGTLATTIRVPLDSSYRFGPDSGGGAAPDTPLQPYDNVLILRQTGWDVQRLVYLTGQVKHPGQYALRNKTERLANLLERAGGLTPEAYAGGVQFYRAATRGPLRPEEQIPAPISERVPRRNGTPHTTLERVGIDLPRVLRDPKFRDNVILVAGDSVHIPEYNPIVMIDGGVNAPGPVAYSPGKSIDWYVAAAGGYAQTGDDRRAYVTQPDGRRESVQRRVLFADHLPEPRPGAVVFVPTKVTQESGGASVSAILSTAAQLLTAVVTIIVVSHK